MFDARLVKLFRMQLMDSDIPGQSLALSSGGPDGDDLLGYELDFMSML